MKHTTTATHSGTTWEIAKLPAIVGKHAGKYSAVCVSHIAPVLMAKTRKELDKLLVIEAANTAKSYE